MVPPNSSLTFVDGDAGGVADDGPEQRRAPVDIFFRTLADAHGANAVGHRPVGHRTERLDGLKRVKEYGGLVIVQDPAEAEYADMPRNAIATGLVDLVLPVAEMPERSSRYVRTPRDRAPGGGRAKGTDTQADELRDVLTLLRVRTGHDFSNYKPATVLRRIARRMQIHGVATLRDYARFLRATRRKRPCC